MALTINTHPLEVITNAPEFDVTTSLSEDATHQNLRIRATIYQGLNISPIAVLDQAKGLDEWDFFELLKSLTGKCDAAVGGSDQFIGPTTLAEAITGWSQMDTNFDTFTTSGRKITAAITSGAADYAESNDLGSAFTGNVWVIGVESDFVDTGANKAQLVFPKDDATGEEPRQQYAGLDSGELQPNHIYFFFVREDDATPHLFVGNDTPGTNFNGTFSAHKITEYKNNPGVYFAIKFEEVYENASDVTTIGAESWSDTLLFIPAIVRAGETFDDFLIDGASKAMLSRAQDADIKYKFGTGQEVRIFYASVSAYLRTTIVTDAGSSIENDIPNMGWGIQVLNDNIASVDAEDATIGFALSSIVLAGGILYSATPITINAELDCHPIYKALSFVGDLGEETILFLGLPSETGSMLKSFIRNQARARRVLKAYKLTEMVLRTLYETEELRRLLHELCYTEKAVWLFDSDLTDNFRVVVVVTEEVPIYQQNQLIENEIVIEYE